MSEFDTHYNTQIVCPYCGHVQEDSEYGPEKTRETLDCYECEKVFVVETEYDPRYTTKKL